MERVPLTELKKHKGKLLKIRLKNGVAYTGILDDSDNLMNLVLLNAEEYNYQMSVDLSEIEEVLVAKWTGALFIRGSNILYIVDLSGSNFLVDKSPDVDVEID